MKLKELLKNIMKITYKTFSEKGPRNENQDYIRVMSDAENGRHSFILCDGMGGHALGGLAAKIVATSMARYLQDKKCGEQEILSATGQASRTLDTMSEVYNNAMMGTTMVLAHLEGDRLTVAHCGDSRGFVFSKDKELKYRTKDHTMEGDLESLLSRGFFTGHPEKAMPETETMEVKSGDRILLCSDGMWSSMNPEILRDRMMDDKPLEDIMDTFMFMCEKFSQDNYSAILIDIE